MQNLIILLVEDNPDDVALTLDAFQQAKIANRIVVLNDGVAALDYLYREGAYSTRDPGETIAVVLLDLKLPRLDGIEVLRRVRSDPRTRLLPVVVLTSSKETQDLIASYELGANSYIRKPVDFDQFLNAARQLGIYWLLVNEAPPPSR